MGEPGAPCVFVRILRDLVALMYSIPLVTVCTNPHAPRFLYPLPPPLFVCESISLASLARAALDVPCGPCRRACTPCAPGVPRAVVVAAPAASHVSWLVPVRAACKQITVLYCMRAGTAASRPCPGDSGGGQQSASALRMSIFWHGQRLSWAWIQQLELLGLWNPAARIPRN